MDNKRWRLSNGQFICPSCDRRLAPDALKDGWECPKCGFRETEDGKIKGAKYDENKPRPSTVPVEAIEAIMATREYGLAKYAEAEDWRSIEPERWHEALLRHVLAIWEDPTHIDEESWLPSIWHVMTNGAFLCARLKDVVDEKMKRGG